jgi:S-adenosylmethionine:tRNA ribosyltransferase-isomerase
MNKVFDLNSYFYELPEDLIAQYPLKKRDLARLMIVDRRKQTLTHDTFNHIQKYLPPKTAFVINNSKVIPARLLGTKPDTKGQVEVFLLKVLSDGYSFEALLKPLKKIREGQLLDFGKGLQATLLDKDKRIVRFNQKNVLRVLQKNGHIPLPPYIKREDTASDRKDYQTVYAKELGSVAAPTAGLHFTNTLIAQLKLKGHQFLPLTLHIGYGTFKPVESKDIRLHLMHEEAYEISKKNYQEILKNKKNHRSICAVGTTSCRVLESLNQNFRPGAELKGITNLFAYPGFSFTMTDCLVTNFHLPYSSLLMLVTAFGGYDLITKAYQEAIREKYRFYSYGDAMLII